MWSAKELLLALSIWSDPRPGLPVARDLRRANACRQPDESHDVAAGNVGEIMHTQVQATGADCQNQVRGAAIDHLPYARARLPQLHDHIRQHAIADQRAHGMAAGKAPGRVTEDRARVDWASAMYRQLEPIVDYCRTDERRDPPCQQDPLTPQNKEHHPDYGQGGHGFGRAQPAYQEEEGQPRGGGVAMQPLE